MLICSHTHTLKSLEFSLYSRFNYSFAFILLQLAEKKYEKLKLVLFARRRDRGLKMVKKCE